MEIELSDGTILDAPDDADPSAVAKAYINKQNIERSRAASARIDPALYNQEDARQKALLRGVKDVARSGALAGRSIINAVTAPPLLAADAGVQTRNLLTGEQYQLPSQLFNQALNSSGVPQPQGFHEKAADFLTQVTVGGKLPSPVAGGRAPAGFDPRTIRDATLAASQRAGYIVPPSQANPSVTNRVLEGLAGKAKVQQAASAKNQAVTNQLAAKAVGLSDEIDLTPGGLSQLRAEVSQAYAPLRGVGTMRADAQYLDDLSKVSSKFQSAARDFPKLAKTEILEVVEGMRRKSFDSDSAVDAISVLRESADDAYRAGNGSLGKAYRDLSRALEGAIERSLERRGKEATGILKNFREARATIAKTHSVEKALNSATGNVDAIKLAQQLGKKPLSGDLLTAANFGKAFPKSAREITENIPSISPLDAYASAGTALATESVAPLIYPFTREALRAWLLSPTGQRLLATSGPSAAPNVASRSAAVLNASRGLLSQ